MVNEMVGTQMKGWQNEYQLIIWNTLRTLHLQSHQGIEDIFCENRKMLTHCKVFRIICLLPLQCMDEGKNQKCAFQKIKFALDLSSEMVRQQTLESVFYFWASSWPCWPESVRPAKCNFRLEKFKIWVLPGASFIRKMRPLGFYITTASWEMWKSGWTIQLLRSPFPKF